MRMISRIRGVMLLLGLFVPPVCAIAAPEAPQMCCCSGVPSEAVSSVGEYVVYVSRQNAWTEVGALSFDKYFRSKELDLSKYISGKGNVKLRLVQKGGGAAHIDAVLVGDRAPAEVKGIQDRLALKKLSQRDFDVVDAFNKRVDLVFPSAGSGTVLSLTARVEGERISETPFQFPLANLHREMTRDSEFYRYSLMNKGGGPETKEMSERPFFQDYSLTGSGHPSGFTYGWVRNDADNLYVTIDFTPDDTMDGGKDYAKVYVKTAEGLRQFKVSVPETRWGKADFTYTDKVVYQHKVYEFRIPLKDIGVEGEEKAGELLVAFAAYGTATPGICSTDADCPASTQDPECSHGVCVNAGTSNSFCTIDTASHDGTQCTDTSPGDCGIAACSNGDCDQNYEDEPNGDSCTDVADDENPCTEPRCDFGSCVNLATPGEPCVPDPANECLTPFCDSFGTCGVPKPGASCSDEHTGDCQIAKCDPSGNCDQNYEDERNGESCTDVADDGNPCTEPRCDFGSCVNLATPGEPCVPDPANECLTPFCDYDRCGTPKGDFTPCTDTSPGDCRKATCQNGNCDQNYEEQPDGEPCTDDDACTQDDECDNGDCVAGPRLVCNDRDACTIDRCEDGECACSADPACARQGCTPGYWKNNATSKNHNAWSSMYPPSTTIGAVFTIPSSRCDNKLSTSLGTSTLLEGLKFDGNTALNGTAKLLLRSGIAALLNSASPCVQYPSCWNEVVDLVDAALASCDRRTMLSQTSQLDGLNSLSCPLDQSGRCMNR